MSFVSLPFFLFLVPRVLAAKGIVILDKNRIGKNKKRVSLAMLQFEKFRGVFLKYFTLCFSLLHDILAHTVFISDSSGDVSPDFKVTT